MAEQADAWAGNGLKNVWGTHHAWLKCSRKRVLSLPCMGFANWCPLNIVYVIAGFAADIPTLYKLAGELTPFVLHVAAVPLPHMHSLFLAIIPTLWRSPDGLRDVVCSKRPGSARLCLISHIATLKSRVPFIHFFDGSAPLTKSIKLSRWPMTRFLTDAAGRN